MTTSHLPDHPPLPPSGSESVFRIQLFEALTSPPLLIPHWCARSEYRVVQFHFVSYSSIPCHNVQCRVILCLAVQYSAVPSHTHAMPRDVYLLPAVHCVWHAACGLLGTAYPACNATPLPCCRVGLTYQLPTTHYTPLTASHFLLVLFTMFCLPLTAHCLPTT